MSVRIIGAQDTEYGVGTTYKLKHVRVVEAILLPGRCIIEAEDHVGKIYWAWQSDRTAEHMWTTLRERGHVFQNQQEAEAQLTAILLTL